MSANPMRAAARPSETTDGDDLQISDTADARNLIEDSPDLRFVMESESWYAISDPATNLLVEDKGQAVVTRRAQRAARRWLEKAARAKDLLTLKAMSAHATKSLNRKNLNNAIELAKAEPGVTILASALDADQWLLSVGNGVIDLRTGQLRDRRPGDLMTKSVAANYVPDAECLRFKAFLLEVMCGRWELVDFLQVLLGYALFGGNPEQIIVFFVGIGANGKSTLLSVVLAILADYAKTTPAETFVHRPEGAALNDLARLMRARFVSATEAEENRRLAANLIKRLTGNDVIAARYLFKEYFEFVAEFLAVIAVNHRPIVNADDPALWRRMIVFPFDHVVPADQRDSRLVEKLLEERDGILGWMVRGCLRYQQAGRLVVPEACIAAATDYRQSMDSFGAWIADRCVVLDGISAAAAPLYDDFAQWCGENGHQAMSSTKFGAKLVDRGFVKDKTRTANIYRGIGLAARR